MVKEKSISMEEIIKRYRKLYSGAISDCMDKMGLWNQFMENSIHPLNDDMILAGPAFTVFGTAERSMDKSIRLGPKVVDELSKYQVVVMQTNGDLQTGHWGELLTNGAHLRGATGAVVDGGIRDSNAIRKLGFPVFYKFRCPGDARGRWNVTQMQEPVTAGNVLVNPGDFIFGDIDGVVVIPKDLTLDVLFAAEAACKEEDEIRKQILKGKKLSELYMEYEQF